jgi:hypothetical protein
MRDRASRVHPDILEHLPPKKTGVCLLYCFVLSPLISLGAVPHHHLALSVRVNLQLQFIKFLVILPFNFQLSLHLERGTHHAY